MAFKKRETPKSITKAATRVDAMEQIDTNRGATIDYGRTGHEITVASMRLKFANFEDGRRIYNQLLEQTDAKNNELDALEKEIVADYTAVLAGAAGKFGEDANEIEMLGGTRKSERKRPVRKPKP